MRLLRLKPSTIRVIDEAEPRYASVGAEGITLHGDAKLWHEELLERALHVEVKYEARDAWVGVYANSWRHGPWYVILPPFGWPGLPVVFSVKIGAEA